MSAPRRDKCGASPFDGIKPTISMPWELDLFRCIGGRLMRRLKIEPARDGFGGNRGDPWYKHAEEEIPAGNSAVQALLDQLPRRPPSHNASSPRGLKDLEAVSTCSGRNTSSALSASSGVVRDRMAVPLVSAVQSFSIRTGLFASTVTAPLEVHETHRSEPSARTFASRKETAPTWHPPVRWRPYYRRRTI
jgi:hypothetical protein